MSELIVVYGSKATAAERLVCEDLRKDLEAVTGKPVELAEESPSLDAPAGLFVVGTPGGNASVRDLCERGSIPMDPASAVANAGAMKRIERETGCPILVLAGTDLYGLQRTVYRFAQRDLGVDPFAYWTGYEPPVQEGFQLPSLDESVAPPAVPILCYFDNDNDELSNMSQPYLQFDMETWRALIDSLVRIGYNAIDIHDHLGRSEFYRWEWYQKLRPDYHVDFDYINEIIEYAHSRGMKVQIPMYLGWAFKHITEEESYNWTAYQDRWIETWRYYMEKTPLGRGDIFLDRPRSQLWDHEYLTSAGEDVAQVMTEAFTALRDVVLEHNPNAILICDLYTHGMDVWRSGRFHPPHDYIMVWPNNGYGSFREFPREKQGYEFGCYMHAGFWLNHVVQDPYPARIEESMRGLLVDHGATAYCLVNGQTFRHFILNLEAYARAAADPENFSGNAYLREFTERYFGKAAAPHAVSALETLHAVSGEGYVSLVTVAVESQESCVKQEVFPTLSELRDRLSAEKDRLATLRKALKDATKAEEWASDQAGFCHDYVVLPIKLFAETSELHVNLLAALLAWNEYVQSGDEGQLAHANAAMHAACGVLREHLETRKNGDRNPKWATWYDPTKRRPNGGFPDLETLERIVFESK